jgi:hypothetical protein
MSYADEIYQSEIAQGTDPETARSNAYLLSQQPEVDAWSERYLRENPEFAQSLKPGWFSQAEWKSIDPEVLQGRFPHLSDLQFREGGGRTSRYDPDFVPGDDFKVGSVTNAAYKCGRWRALEKHWHGNQVSDEEQIVETQEGADKAQAQEEA